MCSFVYLSIVFFDRFVLKVLNRFYRHMSLGGAAIDNEKCKAWVYLNYLVCYFIITIRQQKSCGFHESNIYSKSLKLLLFILLACFYFLFANIKT